MQQISFHAMHSQMMAAVDSDAPSAARRLEQTPAWFAEWEQRLSRFRPDSELSQINQRTGQVLQISALMAEVLAAALRAERQSAGLVTPAILDALEESGYDRSFEQMLAFPDEVSARFLAGGGQSAARPAASRGIQLKPHKRLLYLAPGTHLDLGGIAKGWSADRAAGRLRRFGPALVDAGGDIAVSGPRLDGEPWLIGVSDPFNREQHIELLMIFKGGVATSGRDYRRWQKGGAWQHHIINPHTGRPAHTDVLTSTVIAPSAQAAEMAAKTTLILGSFQGIQWLDRHPELAGMMVLEDGQMVHSRRWMDFVADHSPADSLLMEMNV